MLSPEDKKKALEVLYARGMQETIQFSIDEAFVKLRDEYLSKGFNFLCKWCFKPYRCIPIKRSPHGNFQDDCSCGSYEYMNLHDIDCLKAVVTPVGGVIILRDSNFKHCKCHQGSMSYQEKYLKDPSCCPNNIKESVDFEFGKMVLCAKSGLVLVCLKDNFETLGARSGLIRF